MRCPVCLDSELVPKFRSDIEVDHCPRCRGMWLDRGELDKLLDLAEASAPEPRRAPTPADRFSPPDRYRDDRDDGRDEKKSKGKKKKRKGAFAELLEDVFDAFD